MNTLKTHLGCVHTESDAATKTMRFQLIFSGTPCGTAAVAIDTFGDNFPRKPVRCWAQLNFWSHRSCQSRHGDLTSTQHGKVQDPTVMFMSCYPPQQNRCTPPAFITTGDLVWMQPYNHISLKLGLVLLVLHLWLQINPSTTVIIQVNK